MPGFEPYDAAIPALLQKWSVPGAAVAVAYDGHIVFARGYGFADREGSRLVQPDTSFRIMSISKTLTAAMTMRLVADGRLSLDDHPFALLNYAMPGYGGAHRDARLDRILVRHLLNHSAGWVWDQAKNPIVGGNGFYPTNYEYRIAQIMGTPPPASPQTMIRYMMGQPMQAEPGTVFRYCPLGYEILGRLIELKTGSTYEQAVRNLLEASYVSGAALAGSRRNELAADEAVYYDYPGAPLQQSQFDGAMVAGPYAYSLPGWDAAGGWRLSAVECLRFLLALDGLNGTPPLLPAAVATDMQATKFPSSYYGYGWFTRYACGSGDDQGHGGGSWGSKTWALRSADGRWHTVLLLNSLPQEAFSGGVFEGEACNALHSLAANFVPAGADLTWTTLGWDAWKRLHFAERPAGLQDDPDHDGAVNLIEYAAGSDPAGCQPQLPASLAVDADGIPVLSYHRVVLAHPLTWTVEASVDGRTWSVVNAPDAPAMLNPEGTLSVAVPVAGSTRARLRVRQRSTGSEAVFEPMVSPQLITAAFGDSAKISAIAPAGAVLRWSRNGEAMADATGATLTLANVQPADAGIYTVEDGDGGALPRVVAIVAPRSVTKVAGDGGVVGENIRHPNGNIYDQVLLTGSAATVTAEPGKVTRTSFIDLTDDIVQVEFSGGGSLTIRLDAASGPALSANYNQDVRYMKGHATIVVADADATTNVAVFSVGRANAVNQALFKEGIAYDGVADLATLAIAGATGRVAGIYLGNAHCFARAGTTGIYAPGVEASGPVRVGNVEAFDRALPVLMFGSLAELSVTGGDLKQDNGWAVRERGIARVRFQGGGRSDGAELPRLANGATFVTDSETDVSAAIVAP
ncbi:MAG TPA: serine hydrolase [Opitutus sp.]|nr:serine hydrolase [Opitutus sp.]